MKTTRDGKKRKRPVAIDKPNAEQSEDKKAKKKKGKKEKKNKTQKREKGDSTDSVDVGGGEVVNSDNAQSLSLMDSIFGGDNNSTGSGSGITTTKAKASFSSSLMDSIFDNDNAAAAANSKRSSSMAALFDNTTISTATRTNIHGRFPPKSKEQITATTDNSNNSSNSNDPENIRKTLKNRKHRSEHRPLLRKALDFPGVFSNEEVDEENGFFFLDDENERAKETADAVRDHGLCVIRNVIDTGTDEDDADDADGDNHPLRDVVLPAAKALQRKLNKALKAHNIHHSTDTFRFREAASRCKGRTDVVFDELKKEKAMGEIGRKVLRNPKLYPIIQNLLGGGGFTDDTNEDVKLVYAGLIFSYPGSCDQPWHQDGMPLFPELPREQSALLQASLPPYALNVFLPLEDDDGSIEKGPTEFIPNSHKWESPDERLRMVNETSGEVEEEEEEVSSDDDDSDTNNEGDEDTNEDDEAIIAPVLKCGDALIYDYRVCHRGTANLFKQLTAPALKKNKKEENDKDDVTGTRRILYLMYARPWFTDHVNFDYTKSAESLFDDDSTAKTPEKLDKQYELHTISDTSK